MDDAAAMRRFAETGDEGAFAEIVRGHIDLVYAAARRQMGEREAAADVTQGVFLLLARKARGMKGREAGLVGWLLKATHFACRAALRAERRRRFYERRAMGMRDLKVRDGEAGWDEIGKELDGALAELSEKDRTAVGLRCLEERTFVEVGAVLGVTEEAARKRVERALEKLRGLLRARGVAAPSVTGLAGMMVMRGIEQAPAGLMGTVGVGSAKAMGIAKAAGKMMVWGQMKVAAIVGVVAAVVMGMAAGVEMAQTRSSAETPSAATSPKNEIALGAIRVGGQIEYRGRVVDENGKGVAGASYRVMDFRPWPHLIVEKEAKTDADGGFSTGLVTMDEEGTMNREVVVDAPGYAWAWWMPLVNEPVWRPRVLQLVKAVSVSGVVRDEKGGGVAGVDVEADLQAVKYGYLMTDYHGGMGVKTDSAGRFAFERIPPGTRMHITARAPGLATASTWDGYHGDYYPVAAGTNDVELTMGKEARIKVQLTHDGKPVAKSGILIEAWAKDRRAGMAYGETNAQGQVELRGLDARTWNLSTRDDLPTGDEAAVQEEDVTLAAGEVRQVGLRFNEGSLLRVRVRDAVGRAGTGPVFVRHAGNTLERERKGELNGEGVATLRLPPGKYEAGAVGWTGKSRDLIWKPVEVGEADAQMEIVAEPCPVFKGRLVDEQGRGVKGMVAFDYLCAYTDEAGRFEMTLSDLDEQSMKVGGAVDESGKLGVGFAYDATDTQEKELVVKPMGAITGRVTDGAGNGLGDAQLSVHANDSGLVLDDGRWIWGIEVKGDGSYRVAPVPSGYRLDLFANRGQYQGYAKVAMEPGEEAQVDVVVRKMGVTTRSAIRHASTLPAEAERTGRISGRVLDKDGKPVVGRTVYCRESLSESMERTTDLKGRFEILRLPVGEEVNLEISPREKGDSWKVRVGTEGVELRLK